MTKKKPLTIKTQKSLINPALRKIEARFYKDLKEKISFKYFIDKEENAFIVYHNSNHFYKIISSLERTEKEKKFFSLYYKIQKSMINKEINLYFCLESELSDYY